MRSYLSPTACLLVALTAITTLIACRQNTSTTSEYTVRYINLDLYEGDTLYLWRSFMDARFHFPDTERGVLDSAIVTNGRASFTGQEDALHFYLIEGTQENSITLYPEMGELTITHIPPPQPGMRGEYSLQSSNPHSKNISFYELQRNGYPIEATRQMLFNNVGNAIGTELLKGWARIYPDELEWVYENSNVQLRDSDYALKELKELLDGTRPLNPGDPFIDFRQVTHFGNDSIVFSEIAGQGIPVCLLFPTGVHEMNLIRNEMETVRNQYPDVRFILPILYTASPGDRDFCKDLETRYNALIINDYSGRGEFKNTIRWKYRERSGTCYSCVFDGAGKLLYKRVLLYDDTDTFWQKYNSLIKVWETSPLSLSSRSSDYLSIPEYAGFKDYILNHPQGISLLLDRVLHHDNTLGLDAYMIDDIVKAKYPDAPALQDYINSGGVKEENIPTVVRDYINKIRFISGNDYSYKSP